MIANNYFEDLRWLLVVDILEIIASLRHFEQHACETNAVGFTTGYYWAALTY